MALSIIRELVAEVELVATGAANVVNTQTLQDKKGMAVGGDGEGVRRVGARWRSIAVIGFWYFFTIDEFNQVTRFGAR